MQQHIIFNNFFDNQQNFIKPEQLTPITQFNIYVTEIYNNWPFVLETYKKYKEGSLKKVDQLQQEWLNFIFSNNINIENYETPDIFLNTHIKQIQN